MNRNVETMRTALKTYHQKALDTRKKAEQMRKELLPDIAAERIKAAQAELEGVKMNTIDQVAAAANEGRKAAYEMFKLKAEDINQADSALLKSGLKLTQKEFDDLCVKYQNNGTMSRILADYVDQRNQAAAGDMSKMIFGVKLSTPEKRCEVWDRLEHTANSIIGNIDSVSGFMSGADNPLVISSVEGFGMNTEV